MCVCIHTFKATKDIAAGQEIFIRYGTAQWFQSKKIPYSVVDYATTLWRPELHPLSCRQNIAPSVGPDGRYIFTVMGFIQSGTVLEISLCVETWATVVDQFPYLWDFVLIGETEKENTGCQQTNASSCAHTPCCVFVDKVQGKVLHFIYSLTLF